MLGQSLRDLMSAASEFASNGDNQLLFHVCSILSVDFSFIVWHHCAISLQQYFCTKHTINRGTENTAGPARAFSAGEKPFGKR